VAARDGILYNGATTMKAATVSPDDEVWDAARPELFPPAQRSVRDIKAALVDEIIKARHEQGYTQRKLEEISGVKQPVIARMERCASDPQLSTVIKLLASLGKTLTVVPLKSS
jgi:DNA-binding XRE family transcriptional regulator